ncbi:hypothetical protein E2C01_068950 [Portunus trituberculatus]|uniref:Uncharacterized protein n=1 Tax=Portunus trituberculatus TaxID=210409 RepID=A0A5B7HXX3_PORTR|nr:hypothetical protein [Portunus trituberculatus]
MGDESDGVNLIKLTEADDMVTDEEEEEGTKGVRDKRGENINIVINIFNQVARKANVFTEI